jgi:hypothetical protein
MKENRILFFLFVALLVVAFFALQSFKKWKKIVEEYPLLREEQRRFILTEGKISDKAKKELGLIYNFDTKTRQFIEREDSGLKYADLIRKQTDGNKKLAEIRQKFWDVVFSENRDLAVKRLDFLKKSPGYNGILFSGGTLDKWRKENS